MYCIYEIQIFPWNQTECVDFFFFNVSTKSVHPRGQDNKNHGMLG